MYSTRWSPGLRQGDIVGPLILPTISQLRALSDVGSLTSSVAQQPVTHFVVPGEKRYVAVVSHDCEFNEDKRNRLLVARLENVPGNLGTEQRTALRESNDVEARAAAHQSVAGVDSFLLDALPGHYEQEQVIVFTTILPLPMKMKADLVAAKRAELQHEHRVRFRGKLAWFAARDAEDINDNLKFDPAEIEAEGDGSTT